MSPGTGSSPPVTAPGMPGSFATEFEMKGCRSHGVAAPKERSNVSRSRLPLEKTRLFPSDRLGNDPQACIVQIDKSPGFNETLKDVGNKVDYLLNGCVPGSIDIETDLLHVFPIKYCGWFSIQSGG